MGNSKVLQVIHGLSPAEQKRLGEYLASPYFNKDENMVLIYNAMLTGRTIPDIWPEMYTGNLFDPSRYHRLQSKLYRHVTDFLYFDRQRKDKLQMEVAKVSEYIKRGWEQSIQSGLRRVEKLFEKRWPRDQNYHWLRYEFEFDKLVYSAKNNPRKKELAGLEMVSNCLKVSYLVGKLRIVCTQMSHRNIFQDKTSPIENPEKLLKMCRTHLAQAPALEIYYHLVMLYHSQKNIHFESLIQFLPQVQEVFTREEALDVFILIHNWLAPMANRDDREAMRLYEVLETGFKLNLIQSYAKMVTTSLVKNYIRLAMRLGKDEKCFEVIELSVKDLPKTMQLSLYHFKEAQQLFHRREFKECKEHLRLVDHKDLFFALSSRILFIKICYCEQELELIESHLQSLQMFVRRQKNLASHHQSLYLKFIRFLRRIVNHSPANSLRKLRTEIENDYVSEKSWLLGIIAKIGKV